MDIKTQRDQALYRRSAVETFIDNDRRLNRNQPDVRDYLTGTLSKLLCDRYSVSYHTVNEKLIDLVTQELNI